MVQEQEIKKDGEGGGPVGRCRVMNGCEQVEELDEGGQVHGKRDQQQ